MSRTAQEVPALIAAVTEHQRFRQLACYSIECLSKVIDPSNRDCEKNLAIAHSCGAGKCVVDVLKRHPGKEDVLLVCCEAMEKLAVDDANSEVIAGEGCVEAILASLEANPEFPEHVLCQALTILDRLCDHKKSLHILVERESIKSLINLLNKGNQKMEVLVSCLKGMSKLTRVHKAGVDFLALQGPPPTMAAMQILSDSVPAVLPDTSEQTALFSGITLFIRLLQHAKKDRNPDSFKSLAEDIKSVGGKELCLHIMDRCEDEPLSKACSKLLSLLFDSSSIEQLIQSMTDGSLSVEMQQHILRMLSSLAVDPASSSDIVRFGGVSVLLEKASDLNLSLKLLDMSIKALLYLSTNLKNIAQMVADRAIETLVRTIRSPLSDDTSSASLKITQEIKANALSALKNICMLPENIPLACAANAVGAAMHCLSTPLLKTDRTLTTVAVHFLELLVNCSHECSQSSHITTSNGSSNGILRQYLTGADTNSIRQTIMNVIQTDPSLQASALRVLYDLCLSSSDVAFHLIGNHFVEDIVILLSAHGKDHVSLLYVCLHVLWTLLLTSTATVAEAVSSAQNKTGVDVVLGCIGQKIRVEAIRKVGVEVIGLLASDALVRKVVTKLNKIASLSAGNLNKDAVGDVALVAITIGVLAMVPEYLAAIFALGGVAPMIQLLSNIMLIPVQDQNTTNGEEERDGGNVYYAALHSLCSALEEIISSADILLVPNLVETVRACVSVLQKHSKLLSLVLSALHLLAAISASQERAHKQLCIDNDILEAIGNILRGSTSQVNIVSVVTTIYSNFSDCDDTMAVVICRRNASKTIISCIEKNLIQLSLDGTSQMTESSSASSNSNSQAVISNTPYMVAQMISGFLPIIYRLSTILPEGRDILRRQGALTCLCDCYEKFHMLQTVRDGSWQHMAMDRADIREWCLKIIRLLLEESDILDTLKRLEKKKESTRPGLFSLTDRSVDGVNAASQDVLRLGLLMLCGPQVVQQIEAAGGVVLLYECLYLFSPTVNTAVCESSLVARARDKFVNYCIQALGRAALGNMDVEATIAIIPLLVAAAEAHPTVAVFVTMSLLGRLHTSVVEALVEAGAVLACLTICQADLDVYPSEVVAAAFSCLALLANSATGLALIVEKNAIHLICQFITESLNEFEEERELLASGPYSSSHLSGIRSALDMLLALVTQYDTSVGGEVNHDILQVICQLIDVFVELSTASAAEQVKEKATHGATSSTFMLDLSEGASDSDDSGVCGGGFAGGGTGYRGSFAGGEDKPLYPDLLATTMDIVKELIKGHLGEQYCTALIERMAVKKLDSLMQGNEDAYLLVTQTAYAMAHLWSVLVVDNRANTGSAFRPPPPPPPNTAAGGLHEAEGEEFRYIQSDSRGYVVMLQSKDFILRTMNYPAHTQDMALQKLLAHILGSLGMTDGGVGSGLMAFIEQMRGLLTSLSSSGTEEDCETHIKDLTQLLQLVGNLLLVDGMLTQDVGVTLFQLLLQACRQLQALGVDGSSAEHHTVALQACLTCLNKLLAIDDAATFSLSETDMEAFIYFLQEALGHSVADKPTKLSLLFLLREVLLLTSSTGSGSFVATVLCLSVDMTQTLLALDVDEHSSGRFRNTLLVAIGGDESENLLLQQEKTLACLFTTVFQQDQLAYLLYGECGYMYVATVCSFLCSPISQNNPSSPLYWKSLLHKFMEETWVAYFGPSFLLALLAELMCPSVTRAGSAVELVRGEILLLLARSIESGILTLIEEQAWVNGLITACAIEIKLLQESQDLFIIASSESQLFTLLTTLADSPVGARGIALNDTVRTWLLDKLINSGETAAFASGIVSKLLFHEEMEVIESLVQNKLTKRILVSLKSACMQDESLAQNALYLLRVLADLLTMEALALPKDTIRVLSDLIYTYSSNEYLIGVATSLKNDLLRVYAVGPEAQLENLLNTISTVHLGADGWIQVPDENGYLYYTNTTDGVSQWEAPEGYTLLRHSLSEIMDIACTTLNNDLSNVALTEQHLLDFYQILIYQGGDNEIPAQVMQVLYAQATHSGPVTRDLLLVLPETHVDVIVAALYNEMAALQAPETDIPATNLGSLERSFDLIDNLLLLPSFRDKLSGEEYIRLLCEACRKFLAHPVVLSKALTALERLTRKDSSLVLLAFKYELHLIMSEIVSHHTLLLPAEGAPAREDFLAFLASVDQTESSRGLGRQTLGGEGGRRGRLLGSASDLECSAFLPVLDLCNLLLALWQSLLAHSITEIVTILSEQCFSAVLLIGHYFLPSTFMVACHLPLISQFASQQECLHTIVTPATVSHLIELISFHIDDITLISSALVLFSDFSAIEREEDEDEDEEEEERFCASSVILCAGGFGLIAKVMHAHMNKPVVLTVCMEVIFNLVEPDSADCFNTDSKTEQTDLNVIAFYETVFMILNRYDFDHTLVLSALQACGQFTSNVIGVDMVFIGEEGRSRMALLLDMCQSLVQEKQDLRVHVGEGEGGEEKEVVVDEEKEAEEDGNLTTKDSIVYSILELLNATVIIPATAQLLQRVGAGSTDNEAVRVVLLVLDTYTTVPALLKECLSFLLTVANIDDNLSQNVGEKGSLLFISMVEKHLEDTNTDIISMIFQLFGRLVFIKQNLMSFVQHKGIGVLLTAMQLLAEDATLVASAVTTLGNIVSSDEECSDLVLEAGTEAAVKAVQGHPPFQPPSDFPEVHSAARSTLLAISARLRAKGRVGTKTNVGTLLSRIGQDVNSVVNSQQDRVKESKLDLSMPDPLLPTYRSALKSGQNITDYVKGSTFARKLWLTSDCVFLILKEDTNNIKKMGRKIKLKNISEVQKGYGPGHYKSGLLGGKKTKAKEDRCLYLSANDQAGPEDAITIEFANASDCDKWFDVFSALLLAAVSCPHYLQEL